MILSDGVPDEVAGAPGDTVGGYRSIDLSPLEYLSSNITVRLLYPTPTVAARWERHVERRRIRLWTLDGQEMTGWRQQVKPDAPAQAQDRLWSWIRDNVDFRVRARMA